MRRIPGNAVPDAGSRTKISRPPRRAVATLLRCARMHVVAAAAGLVLGQAALAADEIAPPRTWPELKEAIQQRADKQAYPLRGFDKGEVGEILGRISSTDRDEWARSWMINGERHAARAKELEATDGKHAAEAYLTAWRYYAFGAWPVDNSPEKLKSSKLGYEAFANYARLASPKIDIITIPVDDRELKVYLQKPEGVSSPPVVITLGGADSFKEFVIEQYGPTLLEAGFAYVAADLPAKGESKLLRWEPGAERIYAKLIDALQARTDIDPARIAILGASAGGYWANRVAYTEAPRLKAAVNWGGPSDHYFDPEWQLKALGTREYLFDLFPVRSEFYGTTTLEDFLAAGPKLSLKGMVDSPTAPMLLVNGERDSQVPIADLYTVIKAGDPKEAWINPKGGHLGRNAEWPDNRILDEVIVPFLQRKLQ